MFATFTIRKKLAFILWGFALIAYVMVGLGFALFQDLTLERRVRRTMEPYVRFVTVGAEAAVAFEDPVRAEEILDTLQVDSNIVNAAIVLDDGRILAGFGNHSDLLYFNTSNSIHLSGNMAELLHPLPHGARLHLTMNLEQLEEETRLILWFIGAGAITLLAITFGQLKVLRRAIISPITTLAAAAENVRTKADYNQLVPAAGDDEVAILGRSFNSMLETIRIRERDLRQLALFQRTLVDSAAYGIISCDRSGIVTSFNAAAEKLLGYKADEIIGIHSLTFWLEPAELAAHARQLSEELGESIVPGVDVFTARVGRGLHDEHEWTFIRKNGARIPVLLSISALKDEYGRFTGIVSLANDLTERKEAEAEIRKLNQELEHRVADRTAQLQAANNELEAFAYSVSHDLRAPLRHIDGYMEMLEKRTESELDEKSRHYMNMICDSAKKMGRLIDDLLSFSRMGRHDLAVQLVDMTSLVKDVIQQLEPEYSEREINWHIGNLSEVYGDLSMLRVVLTNLIGNAVKFTQPRERAEIEIGLVPGQKDETVIFVRDNGVGFDMAYADKLFGVFQRLHRVDEFEGTGIGLANVRRVIDRHGGRTWAKGKLDQGATFYISLPSKPQGGEGG